MKKLSLKNRPYSSIILFACIFVFAGLGTKFLFFSHAAASCNLNATTSNFSSQVSAAIAGQTICLASGSYGTWTGTSKAITLTPASGASASMDFTFGSGDTGFTVDGSAGGGSMTSGGGEFDTGASNITLKNITFNDSLTFNTVAASANILLDSDHWNGQGSTFNADSGCTTPARIHVFGSAQTGLTVSNSTFIDPPAGLSNAEDGIQTGSGITVKNSIFENILDNGGACHQDAIQGVGATGMHIIGNLFINDEDGFADFDVATSDTATDNACMSITRPACITLYADKDSDVEHNTAGPGMPDVLELNIKSGQRNGSGTIVKNNVGGIAGSDYTLGADANNLFSGATSPNINGTPTFVGGASPTTWANFALTATSAGHLAATDGADVGIRTSGGSSGGTGVTGDLNGDGHVNIFDLSIFLSHWQQTGASLPEDFNNDGTVNIFDLSILLSHYGT